MKTALLPLNAQWQIKPRIVVSHMRQTVVASSGQKIKVRKIGQSRSVSKGNTSSCRRPCFNCSPPALFFWRSLFSLPMCLLPLLPFAPSVLGFSGSRLGGSPACRSAVVFLRSVSSFSGSVVVGCAPGVDSAVRSVFPSASVFSVGPVVSRGSLAARSASLVRSVAASSGALVVFPSGPAPSVLVVSRSFRGFGSGSWGSLALALGLGVRVLVVFPASLCPVGARFPAPSGVASRFRCVGFAPCGGSLWLSF